MIPAVEMSQVTHVYVTEREAKLAIERLSVTIMPGNSSVWSGRAAVARRRSSPLLPGCWSRRMAASASMAMRSRDLRRGSVTCCKATICIRGARFWKMRASALNLRSGGTGNQAGAGFTERNGIGRHGSVISASAVRRHAAAGRARADAGDLAGACSCWMNRSPRSIIRRSCSWRIWSSIH